MSDFVVVKQSTFVARYTDVWHAFDELCLENGVAVGIHGESQADKESKTPRQRFGHEPKPTPKSKPQKNRQQDNYPLIGLYRQICEHHALAKQRHYSPTLVASLHERVMVGHELIYGGHKTGQSNRLLHFIFDTFPNRLRQYAHLFWVSFALLYVPMFLMGVACYLNSELIYSVMDGMDVARMESMYDPANREIGRDSTRASDTDLMMFGHYIKNNIGIDFQMYGLGIFAGIGTILATLYNGVVIGAVAGHLTGIGFGSTFWQFVVGHGSFELTAAVIASASGLRLGLGVIAPAPYGRKDALVVAGKESIQMLLGAAIMTFIAAFIEAFWSSSSLIPVAVKYVVAAILWGMVIAYLALAGRRR